MKTLVVYSSRTGNTRAIAEAVAEVLPDCALAGRLRSGGRGLLGGQGQARRAGHGLP